MANTSQSLALKKGEYITGSSPDNKYRIKGTTDYISTPKLADTLHNVMVSSGADPEIQIPMRISVRRNTRSWYGQLSIDGRASIYTGAITAEWKELAKQVPEIKNRVDAVLFTALYVAQAVENLNVTALAPGHLSEVRNSDEFTFATEHLKEAKAAYDESDADADDAENVFTIMARAKAGKTTRTMVKPKAVQPKGAVNPGPNPKPETVVEPIVLMESTVKTQDEPVDIPEPEEKLVNVQDPDLDFLDDPEHEHESVVKTEPKAEEKHDPAKKIAPKPKLKASNSESLARSKAAGDLEFAPEFAIEDPLECLSYIPNPYPTEGAVRGTRSDVRVIEPSETEAFNAFIDSIL